MKRQIRRTRVVLFCLLGLVPMRAEAAPTLDVIAPVEVQIPADGKSIATIEMELRDERNEPWHAQKIKATPNGEIELLQSEVVTNGGRATFFARARTKPGKATVTLEGEGQRRVVEVKLVEPPATPAANVATVVGLLGSFFLLMLMFSLVVEKAVDLIKRLKDSKRPKPRLATYLGRDESLAKLDPTVCEALYCLMMNEAPSGDVTRDQQLVAIAREDEARAQAEWQWTWFARTMSAAIGVMLAWVFGIDLVTPLEPLGVHLAKWQAVTLTGIGASAGAPFWQDMLDKLTDNKKKLG